MDTDRLQKYYRYKTPKWVGPYYYDHPDGEDLLGKLSFCGQMGFLLSAPIGLINAYSIYPFPTSQAGRLLRVFRAVAPGVGMGLAFATTTYYATRCRQKDDGLNYALGGLAAGTVFGAINGSRNALHVSVCLVVVAMIVRHVHTMPDPKITYRGLSPYLRRNLDFSGVPDIKGNWVKAVAPEN